MSLIIPQPKTVDTNTTEIDTVLFGMGDTLAPTLHTPVWFRTEIKHNDFPDASPIDQETLCVLPAKAVIHAVNIKHTVVWTGSSKSFGGPSVNIGITGDTTKYHSNWNQLSASVSDTAFSLEFLPGMENFGSSTNIVVVGSLSGGTWDLSNGGKASIWLLVSTFT